MAAGFVGKVSEKVSFAAKVPTLMKATADNETPTPGYLYQEINKITFESVSNCQLLVDFLNDRLKKSSPHVKYKALKIMTYLSANGQSEFRSSLRHQSEPIRQAASFRGAMSSLHGDALNQKVRKAATELIELLFNIENPESAQQSYIMAGPTGKKMDGFGNTPLQTSTRSTTIFDTMKGLSSHIPALGGYLQSKQDLVSSNNGYNCEISSNSFNSANTSTVKFVNYDPWSEGTADTELNRHVVSELDDGFSMNNDSKQDDDGRLESQLVDKITEEGGVRTVPSRQSLDEFTQKCRSLDIDRVLTFLNSKLDEPTLDVQVKSLHAIEHLLRSGLPDIADKVLVNCVSLQHLINTEAGKIKSKATKVLYTAKSQSTGQQKPSTKPGNLHDEAPAARQKDDLIDDLLGNSSSFANTNPPTQENYDNNKIDIFEGLQIQQDAKPSTKDPSELNDFDLLNVCEESEPNCSKKNDSKHTEVFDPLETGFDKSMSRNNADNIILSLSDQKLLHSSTESSNNMSLYQSEFSNSKDIFSEQFDLFGQQDRSITKPKKEENNDFADLLSFGQTVTSISNIYGNTSASGFQGNTSGQPSLTSQSSLTGQSGLTCQPILTSQAGFAAPNPMLQSLLMTKTSQQSTVPLNLSKPSTQKNDFDFLSKSKREKAFSFVQDEMKASKNK